MRISSNRKIEMPYAMLLRMCSFCCLLLYLFCNVGLPAQISQQRRLRLPGCFHQQLHRSGHTSFLCKTWRCGGLPNWPCRSCRSSYTCLHPLNTIEVSEIEGGVHPSKLSSPGHRKESSIFPSSWCTPQTHCPSSLMFYIYSSGFV